MDKDLFKSRIRLRHLDCFVAVAQERNLGRAALRMKLTQPAISKTLSDLEEIVGVRLLERNRQGAQLTRDGEVFLAHAIPVLEALDAAHGAVGPQQAPRTEAVYVGALPTVAPDLLPAALQMFRQSHADARVTIHTAANAPLLQMLKAGEVDFVLGRMAEPQMMAGLAFELLYVDPLLLVVRAGHPLAGKGRPSLNAVVRYPLVVAAQGTIPRHSTESFLQSRGLKLPPNCTETLSVSVAQRIVVQSDAVWVTPAGAARDEVANGTLAQLAVSTKGTEEPVGLLHRTEGNQSSAVKELMRILREAAATRRSVA
jgi:LysR family transcriptional regulator, pca operon transcriptional activator